MQVLDFVLDLVPSPVINAAARRVVFAIATSICRQPKAASRIFVVLTDFFAVNDEVDRQLETLTLLAANLYYQGTPPSMFKAERITSPNQGSRALICVCQI